MIMITENMKPYTKSWKNGFKALYKDGKEVAHVKVVGNTIQVHVSALGDSVIFTGTLTSTATPTPAPTPTPTPTYAADTYYTVRVPFANSGGYNATAKVSYRDTNELSKLWRAMVKMEGVPGQYSLLEIAEDLSLDNKILHSIFSLETITSISMII